MDLMKVLAPVSELSDVVLVEVGDESEGGGEAEDQSSDQSVEDLPVPDVFDPLNLSRRKVDPSFYCLIKLTWQT